jgi:hypothetical protein
MIRLTVVIIAWGALWYQLRHHGDLRSLASGFFLQFGQIHQVLTLLLVLLLMFVNWSLEALKWQFLIRKSEKISFFRSLKGILTGISVGVFTPNRLGEFAGRSFVLDKTHPWKVFFMTLVGSYSQLLATILFGVSGLIAFLHLYIGLPEGFAYQNMIMAFFAIMTVMLLMLLYFNIWLIDKHLGRWLRKKRPGFAVYLHVISQYSRDELQAVLVFSILRYFVFSMQFLLLLHLFDLPIPFWQGMIFIGVVYLVMTLIPTFALSEIGIRGSAAIYFFGFYYSRVLGDAEYALGVVGASSVLWFINLVLPAILGTFFVYHLRVFRNNQEGV